jgi:hypothetical protein
MPEPRDPLLKVLIRFVQAIRETGQAMVWLCVCWLLRRAPGGAGSGPPRARGIGPPQGAARRSNDKVAVRDGWGVLQLGNDPSAGSPTETLLRLLLPLNDRVWITFRPWVVVADLPGPVRKPH